MELLHQALLAVLVLALVLFGAWCERRLRLLRDKKKARDAAKRGFQGERDAEKLIKQLGYKIVLRHPPATYAMAVDGDPQGVQLTADFLLELKGKRLIAEVKTGKAAKLEQAETRRQMLEYQLAFGVDALLLIDMDAKQVRTVRFPLPKTKPVALPIPATAKKRATTRWVVIGAAALLTTWLISLGFGGDDADAAAGRSHAPRAKQE